MCYNFKTVLQTFPHLILRKSWNSGWNRLYDIYEDSDFMWSIQLTPAIWESKYFYVGLGLSRTLFTTSFLSLLLTEKLTNMIHKLHNITRKVKKDICILLSSVFKCHFKGSKYTCILSKFNSLLHLESYFHNSIFLCSMSWWYNQLCNNLIHIKQNKLSDCSGKMGEGDWGSEVLFLPKYWINWYKGLFFFLNDCMCSEISKFSHSTNICHVPPRRLYASLCYWYKEINHVYSN